MNININDLIKKCWPWTSVVVGWFLSIMFLMFAIWGEESVRWFLTGLVLAIISFVWTFILAEGGKLKL